MKLRESNSKNIARRRGLDGGWTLFEIIVVVFIVATISIVTVVKLRSPNDSIGPAVAQLVLADIAFAQELAVSSGQSVSVSVNPGEIDDDDDDHGHGHGHDDDDDDGDHDRGHGNDDDHDDDDNPGHGHDDDDDDDDEGDDNHGHGNDDDHDDDDNPGHGHDDDDDDDNGHGNGGGHGRGRGHGHGFGQPHDCDDGCAGAGYSITFVDGSPVPYPIAAAVSALRGSVTIETLVEGFRFDSGGRLIIPDYNWQSGQTSVVVMRINGTVDISLTRETGKVTVTNNG